MTGPEHYRIAELTIKSLIGKNCPKDQVMGELAAAQVHATLALAAATAMTGLPITPEERQAWWDMGTGVRR